MDCVVLAVTVTWLCGPVVELNLVVKLDLVGSICAAIAVLNLLVVDLID